MAASVYMDMSTSDQLAELLAAEGVAVAADAGSAGLVVRAGDRQESDMAVLYAGGWIACATAMALAKKLGVSLAAMGRLLEELNVKVRRCSLGCF